MRGPVTRNKSRTPFPGRHTPGRRAVYRILLWLYLALLFYLTWFPGPFRRAGGAVGINLTPFATIRRYIHMEGTAAWINLAGNLAAFLPLGFLGPRSFVRYSRWWHTVLISLCVSLLVEAVQYLTGMGSLDVDDVIINILGGLAGFLLHRLCRLVYDNSHYTRGEFNK